MCYVRQTVLTHGNNLFHTHLPNNCVAVHVIETAVGQDDFSMQVSKNCIESCLLMWKNCK